MKGLILGLIFIISPFFSYGHNPLSAKYHLEAGEKVSLLTINLSQDGVNQAMLKKLNERELTTLSENEFKELIVAYVKSNFRISFDEQQIELGKGGVKLGSHQTDLKFVLPPLPIETKIIDVYIPAFKENGTHQTIFSYKTNQKSDYKILNSKNNFHSTIMLKATKNINYLRWVILFSLIITVLLLGKYVQAKLVPKG